MVGVFCSKPTQNNTLLISFAIAVCVLKVKQAGTVDHVCRVGTVWCNTRGNQKSISKHRAVVGDAISIRVTQNNDFVVGDFPRFDLWVNLATCNPQSARRIKVHLDRFADVGV